ncbi:acyl-CoA dehydrogenase, C-terminal domain protein [Pseudoramibacter alactolyticus ATCC 23263]|uniref:Acyl-CoA dehydrogenase, C-terminal domain protein n=1 Tax=Pseudoramibacter alactolyticus ATCC 23263 TaxID=887929 RepID=E6MHY4_9FIRM|nr:acyl-CoA dehydrogenase family protein [Pseudoramibacter alactolyticus]EFV01308.1 acyl-CoA dehydrogenase, C-terminal domain protein [Pseudoramibacter alactolyticus ATCC 23263]
MSVILTEDEKMIVELAADFAKQAIAPTADEMEAAGKIPKAVIAQMAELGFMGINIPEAYGGIGMGEEVKALVIEEIAKADASVAELLSVHTLSSDIINRHGTEEQKEKYLARACSGQVGAFALTEPGAGSDAAAAKTKAVPDGDDYVINGTKCFISNMGKDEGDYVILIALTDPEKKTRGMSAIIVDRGTPGFSVGKAEDKMGLRAAPVSELIFEDCRVPKTQLLGEAGKGFGLAMAGLDGGRIGMAAQAVGLAEGALTAAVQYAGERVQFGKPISANQGIQWYLADMATRTEAAKLLTLNAAKLREAGLPVSKEAAMAKYYASEAAVYVADKALQIHGGYGYMKDYAIERVYRDARIIPLYEGTSEVQKMVISRAVIAGR